jgi:two-component system nitrogen regulation sensor histidine kinase GlnL
VAFARGGLRVAVASGPACVPPPAPTLPGFAEIFAAHPVATLVLDGEGAIVHANIAAEHLLNLSERAMRRRPLDAVIVPPAGYAARRPGHGFATFDAEVMLVRGGRFRADFAEAVISEPSGWRIVTLNAVSVARRGGQGSDRPGGTRAAVGAAAMLAHEIKNPLSGIRGAAQLLASADPAAPGLDAAGPGMTAELTCLITSEVDRIAALIDRMQDFTDTRPPNLQRTNIYPLLSHARQVAIAGFARDMPIEERFDPSLPDVMLDRDAFLQVMINLLKNAAEAVTMIAAPRITLATAYRHGVSFSLAPGKPRVPLPIEIIVADNGPGAPADLADHLFEPFVSGKRDGRGLGLPLVEKLLGDMGGIVQYAREGDPEHTVFRVLLPRAPEPRP